MRPLVRYALSVVAVGLAGNALRLARVGQPEGGATPSMVACTVKLHESVWASGSSHSGGDYTVAYRSDGTYVELAEHYSDPRKPVIDESIYYSSGLRVHLDRFMERKSSLMRMPSDNRSRLRDSRTDCVRSARDEVVAREAIGGVRTVKVKREVGGAILTSWFAPDYNCAELKAELLGMDGERNEKVLSEFRAGEPDPGLFDVPGRFAEVPPSVLFEMTAGSEAALRADIKYNASRPK